MVSKLRFSIQAQTPYFVAIPFCCWPWPFITRSSHRRISRSSRWPCTTTRRVSKRLLIQGRAGGHTVGYFPMVTAFGLWLLLVPVWAIKWPVGRIEDGCGSLDHLEYLQQNGRYQPPQILPVCENNHNRPNLVFIASAMLPWGWPYGIGNIALNSKNKDDLLPKQSFW